jgi:threonine/homoserine/homoserine lactone efflux protein
MFLASYALGFSGAVTPGPMVLVTMAESAKSGVIAAVMIVAGHAFLEALATLGLSLGLLSVAERPSVVVAASLLGGLYLLWVAGQTLRDAFRGGANVGSISRSIPSGRGLARLFGIGILVSIGNPYWTIWWLAVAPSLLTGALQSPATHVPAFYVGHELADLSWYYAVGLAVAAGGSFFGSRLYRMILAGCGVFLVFFAGYFLVKAGRFLAG